MSNNNVTRSRLRQRLVRGALGFSALVLLAVVGFWFLARFTGLNQRWVARGLAKVGNQFRPSEYPAYWREDWDRMARMGGGFLVWESNRTGSWRIWRRELDGSGLRQLSAEEAGHEHYCPHIAPDGGHVVYLSYPAGASTYDRQPPAQPVPLWLMKSDGTGGRVLVESARAYLEDRAVVWLNERELLYISGTGATHQLNIETGHDVRLTVNAHPTHGWLIDPTMSYATDGEPSFSTFDQEQGVINTRASLGGCQPYFTRDGIWAYYMGWEAYERRRLVLKRFLDGLWGLEVVQEGGPLVKRIHLPSRTTSNLVEHRDARLPAHRRWVYFPMISANSRLMAFGASPDEHAHFTSDYDIFVGIIDPQTLELVERPVRYTFDRATDRYPDVYLNEPELGWHDGEAPFTVQFAPPGPGEWDWDFGDGARGDSPEHRYERAGLHFVRATRPGRSHGGVVWVRPASAPEVVALVKDGLNLRVYFDEPVVLDQPTAELKSGIPMHPLELDASAWAIRLTLTQASTVGDTLQLAGIRDTAQSSNATPPLQLPVPVEGWPIDRRGLVFVWENARQPNLVAAPQGGALRSYPVHPVGRARLTRDYAMALGASDRFTVQEGEQVLLQCDQEFSLELVVQPAQVEQTGVILSFGDALRLIQSPERFVLETGIPAADTQSVEIRQFRTASPTHLGFVFDRTGLRWYWNGTLIGRSGNRLPRLAGSLVFGGGWCGVIEDVAVYNRALEPEEILHHERDRRERRDARKPVEPIEVELRRVALPQVPTLEEISPYRDALVMVEYAVVKVLRGSLANDRVRIAQWAILNGEPLPDLEVPRWIEPFEDNPQLHRIFLSDTLVSEFDIPVYCESID